MTQKENPKPKPRSITEAIIAGQPTLEEQAAMAITVAKVKALCKRMSELANDSDN
ncbi:MAG: hypothetical protein WBD47_09425 [Phormidesmis sp.]